MQLHLPHGGRGGVGATRRHSKLHVNASSGVDTGDRHFGPFLSPPYHFRLLPPPSCARHTHSEYTRMYMRFSTMQLHLPHGGRGGVGAARGRSKLRVTGPIHQQRCRAVSRCFPTVTFRCLQRSKTAMNTFSFPTTSREASVQSVCVLQP